MVNTRGIKMKVFKYLVLTIISLLSILILWINIKLHSINNSFSDKEKDISLQLNFLEYELKSNNLGVRMQQVFPEGFVFINAIYGLTWCELAMADSLNGPKIKERALKEAIFAYNAINSKMAKSNFEKKLDPEYGIFYAGWKNYLLSKILSIDTTFIGHQAIIDSFKYQCNVIKNTLVTSKSPFLQSYDSHSWPADMFVAIASLSNHDKIFSPLYKSEINKWLNQVKNKIDPLTLMVPHKVDSRTGELIQGTRGCSMSLILRMLGEINSDFSKNQFDLFKQNFVTTTFGLPSVREYPKGNSGFGDIDSGPVIFGVGFTATIAMIGPFSMYGYEDLADNQYKTVNAFGFSFKDKIQKKYLLGKLPMADAFIVWGRATGLKNAPPTNVNSPWSLTLKFHLISLLTLTIFWAIFFLGRFIINSLLS